MTLLTPPNGKAGFADLREQFASLVSEPPVPADEFGKLPASPMHPRKRGTLHLSDSIKKTSLKTLSEGAMCGATFAYANHRQTNSRYVRQRTEPCAQ